MECDVGFISTFHGHGTRLASSKMLSKLSIVGTAYPPLGRTSLLKRVSSRSDIESYELLCREESLAMRSPTTHLEKKRKKVIYRELLSPVMKKSPVKNISPQKYGEYVSYFRSKDIVDSDYYEKNFSLQFHRRPIPDLMEFQKELNCGQRTNIIKWIFKVGHELGMSSEHIVGGICLFERCLGKQQYTWRSACRLSIACLILSSKLDDLRDRSEISIYTLYINRLDTHGFTTNELWAEESNILNLLNYELVQPNSITFIIIFLEELDLFDKEVYLLCSFITELFIGNYQSQKYLYSTIAETVVKIVLKSMDLECKNDTFYNLFKSISSDTINCASDIKTCVLTSNYKDNLWEQYNDVQSISLNFNIEL